VRHTPQKLASKGKRRVNAADYKQVKPKRQSGPPGATEENSGAGQLGSSSPIVYNIDSNGQAVSVLTPSKQSSVKKKKQP